MCVITDEKHVVRSISLIPGADLELPHGWHVYFPVIDCPKTGEVYLPSDAPKWCQEPVTR